jgi:hypothetical protein
MIILNTWRRVFMSETEKIKVIDWTENMKIIGLLSLVLIVGVGFVLYMKNPQSVLVLFILSLLFLPFGIILGYLFFNPYMRVKMLRALTKRNYGFLNLVLHGNVIKKTIVNLDKTYVMKDKNLWIISPKTVYNVQTGEKHPIQQEHIQFTSGVPELFVSYESMVPIVFDKKKEILRPGEVGSTILEYISVQTAKDVFFQRRRLNLIAVIVCILALMVGYNTIMLYQIDNQISKSVKVVNTNTSVVDFTKNMNNTGGVNVTGSSGS